MIEADQLDKLRNAVEKIVLQANNAPVDDFCGLSPNQIHYLVYEPFGDKSIVQLCPENDDQTLDQISLFRLIEEYLRIIEREKYLKLTPLGALQKKVLVELYEKRILLDDHIEIGITKLSKEHDWIALMSARIALQIAGLVRKANGKLALTKKAEKLLAANDRQELFRQFFQAFTEKFLWSSNDGYPEHPIGQFGWAFTIYLISKFGDKPVACRVYAEQYLRAFPAFLEFFEDRYSTAEEQFYSCYLIRTFPRFLEWFGFVNVERQNQYSDLKVDKIKQSPIFKSVFVINEPTKQGSK